MAVWRFDPQTTALLIIDLQNDTVHPKGAYGRAGLITSQLGGLPQRLLPVCEAMRRRDSWIVATHFTILEGKAGKPIITDHMRQLRPFLKPGDFQRGSWGHQVVDAIGHVDLHLEKFTFSAFDMTPLEWTLRQIKVDTILIAGVTTPVSVATTLRDAIHCDFRSIVLEDGVGALEQKQHRSALTEMASIATVRTCGDVLAQLS